MLTVQHCNNKLQLKFHKIVPIGSHQVAKHNKTVVPYLNQNFKVQAQFYECTDYSVRHNNISVSLQQ